MPKLYHLGVHLSMWYNFGMDKHKQSAKTIRIEDPDREAIAAIRAYYGVSSDNDAIRIALREIHRQIRAGTIPTLSTK
jgi:hypothetical protein